MPGSMPVDSAGSDSRQDLSTQEFSQTTFGGSTLEDVLSVSRHAVLLPALKQEGRNLVEYFEFAEGFRAQLPPQSRESVFVETFLEGLEDTEAKSFLQSQANNDGWTWDAMSTALRQLGGKRVEDEQAQSNMAKQGTAGKSGQSSKAPATGARARRRGRKRRISIVSTDGEDIV